MDDKAVAVVAPPPRVYRVARRGGDPFAPPPWDRAGPDGTFGNRFDDPGAEFGLAPQQRYRVIYCASTAEGAFAETVARFRPSVAVLAKLRGFEADESPQAQSASDWEPETFAAGVVPADWRLRRVLAQAELAPSLRFVDFAAPKTHQYLRIALAPSIAALGLTDLDVSTLAGPHRPLTQRVARHIYELNDRDGRPLFAGVRYVSRFNIAWECWAVFADRIVHSPPFSTTIAANSPDLVAICGVFGLGIETSDGENLEEAPNRH